MGLNSAAFEENIEKIKAAATGRPIYNIIKREVNMKFIKFILFLWDLFDALAWGITRSGRVEILPADDCNSHDESQEV